MEHDGPRPAAALPGGPRDYCCASVQACYITPAAPSGSRLTRGHAVPSQDVCWAGQTLEGALAELAGDRLGLASLSGELGGVSQIDLRAEPVGPSELGIPGDDISLRCFRVFCLFAIGWLLSMNVSCCLVHAAQGASLLASSGSHTCASAAAPQSAAPSRLRTKAISRIQCMGCAALPAMAS